MNMLTLNQARADLGEDIQRIKDNIQIHLGKLTYIHYGLGVGKSTSISNMIASIAKRYRVLILSAENNIAKEWEENVKRGLVDGKVYRISAPSSMDSCTAANNRKLGLYKYLVKYCNHCEISTDNCLKSYRSKIRRSNVVITNYSFHYKYLRDDNSYDIIVYDEIFNLDKIKSISMQDVICLNELLGNIDNLISIGRVNAESVGNIPAVYDSAKHMQALLQEYDTQNREKGYQSYLNISGNATYVPFDKLASKYLSQYIGSVPYA